MLFADDMVLKCETVEEVEGWLGRIVRVLEEKGMKVNRAETECMFCDWAGTGNVRDVQIQDWKVSRVEQYKYLGSVVEEEGGVSREIKARIQAGWGKWSEMSGVLCAKRLSRRLRGRVYATVVRPMLLYRTECWLMTKNRSTWWV